MPEFSEVAYDTRPFLEVAIPDHISFGAVTESCQFPGLLTTSNCCLFITEAKHLIQQSCSKHKINLNILIRLKIGAIMTRR
jgi:hypothetical protein